MKAAIVTGPNQVPVYADFKEPVAETGHEVITVTASALSNLTKGRASGEHYSSSGAFPMVVGVDGVGRRENGQRVYFALPKAPFGAMAEKVLVASTNCFPIPDGVDDIVAAAIANPGMSSMAALKHRAAFKVGETVLINGATGSAGQVAVQIAKYLGAKKIIATGRDEATLQKLKELGADVTINLTLEPKELEAAFVEQVKGEGVDVVLDYIYGSSAEMLLIAIAKNYKGSRELRYVSIGGMSGAEIKLPSAILRAVPITLMGSGIGSVGMQDLLGSVKEAIDGVIPGKFRIDTTKVPLVEVEKTWNGNFGKSRVVFVV